MTKKKERDWLRTLDAARYYYKVTGDRIPSEQTVRNWMTKGKRAYDGSKIKLKYVNRGNMRVTCAEWVRAFAEDVSNGPAERIIREPATTRSKKRRPAPPPPPPA